MAERVGGENMSTFQVWADGIPAKNAPERIAREEQLRENAEEVKEANERARGREAHKNPAVDQLNELRCMAIGTPNSSAMSPILCVSRIPPEVARSG
jgi:hypothetical protein